jgi:hypothetical protein
LEVGSVSGPGEGRGPGVLESLLLRGGSLYRTPGERLKLYTKVSKKGTYIIPIALRAVVLEGYRR